MNKAVSLLFIVVFSGQIFAENRNVTVVPVTTLPNEKNHEYEELIDLGQLDRSIDLLKEHSADFYLFKRLHNGQVDPNTPMVRDDAETMDRFATCNVQSKPSDNQFLNLSVRLDQTKGVMVARYPLEYKCRFNKNALLKAFDEYVALYGNTPKQDVCDGKQMYGYVKTAIEMGYAVLKIASDPTWGARAPRLAVTSDPMGYYESIRSDMREHDLFLVRSGCSSLTGGPTNEMIRELKVVEQKLNLLVSKDYTQTGIVTGSFGQLK
ncbi:hypothetical protein ACEUCH_02565 [Aeromonas hydrophila]|uniref:hypothetical protein n=1 Tax=Aeromonas hydrophila TaxID=644 RepID=UPI0038D13ECE